MISSRGFSHGHVGFTNKMWGEVSIMGVTSMLATTCARGQNLVPPSYIRIYIYTHIHIYHTIKNHKIPEISIFEAWIPLKSPFLLLQLGIFLALEVAVFEEDRRPRVRPNINGNFRTPKMEVLWTIVNHIYGHILLFLYTVLKFRPYTVYGRYLEFRSLKWQFKISEYLSFVQIKINQLCADSLSTIPSLFVARLASFASSTQLFAGRTPMLVVIFSN